MYKRSQIDSVVIYTGLILATIILVIWSVNTFSKSNISSQDLYFYNLKKFSSYYNILCYGDKVYINTTFSVEKDTIFLIKNKTICELTPGVIKTCTFTKCNAIDNEKIYIKKNTIVFLRFIKNETFRGIKELK